MAGPPAEDPGARGATETAVMGVRAWTWWAVLAVVVAGWLVAAVLRVSRYSESTDPPPLIEPAVLGLPVVAVVVLAVAVVATVRARARRF